MKSGLCILHIFSLSSNAMFGLLSFLRHIITGNILSYSLNAAVVLQQCSWLIGADLSGVDFYEVYSSKKIKGL